MKMIQWSLRTFWYKGLVKHKDNIKFEKSVSVENNSPGSKADFQFFLYLEVDIECVAYDIK